MSHPSPLSFAHCVSHRSKFGRKPMKLLLLSELITNDLFLSLELSWTAPWSIQNFYSLHLILLQRVQRNINSLWPYWKNWPRSCYIENTWFAKMKTFHMSRSLIINFYCLRKRICNQNCAKKIKLSSPTRIKLVVYSYFAFLQQNINPFSKRSYVMELRRFFYKSTVNSFPPTRLLSRNEKVYLRLLLKQMLVPRLQIFLNVKDWFSHFSILFVS